MITHVLTKEDYRLKEKIVREVVERTREEEEDGEKKILQEVFINQQKQKVEVVKRQTLVRKRVLDRKNMVKFGTKENEARGLGKETFADEQISIQTTKDMEKADIEIVKRIKNLNTDKIKANKLQQQLLQKEAGDKREDHSGGFIETKKTSGLSKLDQLMNQAQASEAKLCVRNIIIDSKEERQDFKEKIEELIKKNNNCKVNVDLREDRRGDYYAYVFLNDKSLVNQVIHTLQENRYNQCVLEVQDETNKPQRTYHRTNRQNNRR